MTNTIIMITTGIDRRDRLSMRVNRLVEPLDMSDYFECILQVFEMQDGGGITNVYSDICGGRLGRTYRAGDGDSGSGPLAPAVRAAIGVDTLNGSRHANMKELRFSAAGDKWRVAFAFDTRRKSILLIAGDKFGGRKARLPRTAPGRRQPFGRPSDPAG